MASSVSGHLIRQPSIGIRFLAFHNEQSAGYAASSYGYLTGKSNLLLTVSGLGCVHGLAGPPTPLPMLGLWWWFLAPMIRPTSVARLLVSLIRWPSSSLSPSSLQKPLIFPRYLMSVFKVLDQALSSPPDGNYQYKLY